MSDTLHTSQAPTCDFKTKDFWYDLPQELIAQTPLEKRDSSRLLVMNKETGELFHRHFYDIVEYLNPGDCLVMNDSRVLPARLLGHRPTGGAVELLLLRDLGDKKWECLAKPGKKLRRGQEVIFGNGELTATVEEVQEDGNRIVRFHYEGIFLEILEHLGKMPLPPYIQTLAYVTLHVGLGTFRPVKAEQISQHHMHSELCMLSHETAQLLNDTRKRGGRIVCVGTTSCRTLESLVEPDGTFEEKSRWTDIFIYPGYTFRAMDALITNFHLPESTLVMLVSAFAGRDHILHAYEEAVKERYRFFSFGDAMFLY